MSESPVSLIADAYLVEAGSSFEQALPDPGVDPTSGELVAVLINRAWKPLLAGAALQLLMPASWEYADETALNTVLDRAALLLEAIVFAEPVMMNVRYTPDCHLQTSTDGGVTWTTVPGWDENIAACARGWVADHDIGALVMQPGVYAPPAPVWTPDGTDWVYVA